MAVIKAFYLPYYKRFECIANKCKSNCCKGWLIAVTKEEYESYINVEDEDLRQQLITNITICDGDSVYAKINMDNSGNCAFIGKDGLCTLQSKMGHDFLSKTCRSYPRVYRRVGADWEVFLRFSCEAVIDKALFDTGIMKFEEDEIEIPDNLIGAPLQIKNYTSNEKGLDIFWHLRIASVIIVQSRRYKIWERMALLGLFTQQTSTLFAEGKEDNAQSFTEDFISKLEQGAYNDYIGSLNIRFDKALEIMAASFSHLLPTSRKIYGGISKIAMGLDLHNEEQDINAKAANFTDVTKKYYMPFFEHKEYIFEHCIVNSILMDGFPFSYNNKNGNIYDNYYKLALKFGLLKFGLVGICGYYKKEVNRKNLVVEIADYLKCLDHSHEDTIMNLANKLKEKDLMSSDVIASLFKDW